MPIKRRDNDQTKCVLGDQDINYTQFGVGCCAASSHKTKWTEWWTNANTFRHHKITTWLAVTYKDYNPNQQRWWRGPCTIINNHNTTTMSILLDTQRSEEHNTTQFSHTTWLHVIHNGKAQEKMRSKHHNHTTDSQHNPQQASPRIENCHGFAGS
jgi:hypothetical protein